MTRALAAIYVYASRCIMPKLTGYDHLYVVF